MRYTGQLQARGVSRRITHTWDNDRLVEHFLGTSPVIVKIDSSWVDSRCHKVCVLSLRRQKRTQSAFPLSSWVSGVVDYFLNPLVAGDCLLYAPQRKKKEPTSHDSERGARIICFF